VNAKKEIQGIGTASTKKQAQQLAAKNALSKLTTS
jgi:dsRNA-specific ribonuclease